MTSRIAIVADIHGNLPALEAILADIAEAHPDLVVLGGDLALGGPNPVEVVDRIRELGWPSVLGNTDSVLADEHLLPPQARGFVQQPAARSREMLGPERCAWLTSLPMEWRGEGIALVHAAPGDCWAIVPSDASDESLRESFGPLGVPIAAYGHIHHPYVRRLDDLTVVNTGSVSLALDGDVRATYVIIEDGRIEHRRVAYDVEAVAAEILRIAYPHAEVYAGWLRTGVFPDASVTPPKMGRNTMGRER